MAGQWGPPAYYRGPHPYAQFPYAARPQVDPRYAGPGWAAPAPYPMGYQPRPASSGCGGCLKAALWLSLVVGGLLLMAGIGLAVSLDGAERRSDRDEPEPEASDDEPSGERDLFRTGVCRELDGERDTPVFHASRNSGVARSLSGRVALLHFRVELRRHSWSAATTAKVEAAMVAGSAFLEREARRRNGRVSIEAIPWPLASAVDLPALQLTPANMVAPEGMQALRQTAEEAVRASLGESLEAIVVAHRRRGFDSVGLLFYLPVKTSARPFALYTYSSPPNAPEVAILFADSAALDSLAVIVSHESLHLFGAPDLYRVTPRDRADEHDIMNDFCLGFRETTVGDATAYAVGWEPAPPQRRYPIRDR